MLTEIKYIISKLIKKLHIPSIKSSIINKKSKICSGSQIVNCNIDKYTYVGNNCTLVNTDIGSFCSIADNCIIGGSNHPINWVSTSPVFYHDNNILKKNFSNHEYSFNSKTIIGNDVWIGSNCLLKSGISIASGAIIGMGSVVTKDVGYYEIWAGNPARLVRKRFNDDVISKIIKSEWWCWDDNHIKNASLYFNNIQLFLEKIDIGGIND